MAPKAASGAKKTSSGPSYQEMIKAAIVNLKDRAGSSRAALKKYILANNPHLKNTEDTMFTSLFNRVLKAGVASGVFLQPKGSSGGTKLAKGPAAKPAAAKKTATKTAAPKKAVAAKKTAAPKKAGAKKAPAPKKEVASPKKAPAKKAAPKKAAAKPAAKTGSGVRKTVAKKAAPKKTTAKKEKA